MVLDGIQVILTASIVTLAVLAAIAGIVVLESFFRSKLKELFSDISYFIFFFLVCGYILYSIGEVSFYLETVVLKDTSNLGIADVYWTGGASFIMISFLALAVMLFKQHYDSAKLTKMLVIGGGLMAVVVFLLFGVTLGEEAHFFSYFYPLASSLIVAFAISVVLFSSQLGQLSIPLKFFLLASSGILLGDILFTYINTQGIYGTIGMLADIFYLFGYGTSFVAFVLWKIRVHHQTA